MDRTRAHFRRTLSRRRLLGGDTRSLDTLRPAAAGRSSAPRHFGLALAGCFALLFGIVAAPLLARRPAPAPRAALPEMPAGVATSGIAAASGFAVPDHPFMMSEEVYRILARDEPARTAEAARPTAPPVATVAAESSRPVEPSRAVEPARVADPAQVVEPARAPETTVAAAPALVVIAPPSRAAAVTPMPESTVRRASVGAPDASTPRADPFVGVWGTEASACSPRSNRRNLLLAAIDNDGAWAGETFCAFADKRQTAEGWTFAARCKSPRERWTAKVRLRTNGHTLTWSSQRGSQRYVRCERRLITAQAALN